MQRRGISEDEIKEVYLHPVQKIKLVGGREIWQNQIERDGKVYVLRIVVGIKPNLSIVTVYRSSNVKKYWMEET